MGKVILKRGHVLKDSRGKEVATITCDIRKGMAAKHKHYCMASCDSVEEAQEARDRGWRTFRVTESPGDKVLSNEVVCPASDEAGHKLQCIQCGACDGTARGLKSHIIIQAHGAKTKRFEEYNNG